MDARRASPETAPSRRRPVIAAAVLSLALLSGLWLFSADLGFLAPRLERMAREATGREVRIDRLELRLGRRMLLGVEGLEVPSAAWDEGGPLLQVDRLRARVDLFALLGGTLQIDTLELDGARLGLLRTADGRANWRLRRSAVAGEAHDEAPTNGDASPLAIALGEVRVSELELAYTSPTRAPVRVEVASASRSPPSTGAAPVLQLRGRVDGRPLTLDGTLGRSRTIAPGAVIDFDLAGRFEGLVLEARGALDSARPARSRFFSVALRGPAAGDLERLLGLPAATRGAVDLRATLEPRPDGTRALELRGDLGTAHVDATAEVDDLGAPRQAEFAIDASGAELGRLLRLLGLPRPAPGAFELRLQGRRDGSLLEIDEARLVHGDARLEARGRLPEFPGFAGGRAQGTVRGTELRNVLRLLGRNGESLGPFSADFSLDSDDAGRERLALQLEAAGAVLHVEGSGAAPGRPARLGVEAEGADLRDLGAPWGVRWLPAGAFTLRADLLPETGRLRLAAPATLRVGDALARLEGEIALARRGVGTALEVQMDVPDAAPLQLPRVVADTLASLPVELAGRWEIEADGHHFRAVSGRVGAATLTGEGRLGPVFSPLESELQLAMEGPRLEALTEALQGIDLTPGPFELSGRLSTDGDAVHFEDVLLVREYGRAAFDVRLERPLAARAGRVSLTASGPDLSAFSGRLGGYAPAPEPFEVDVQLAGRGSDWRIDAFEARFAGARVDAQGSTEGGGAALRGAVRVPSLARLGRLDGRRFVDLPFEAEATLVPFDGGLSGEDLRLRLGESRAVGAVRWQSAPDARLEAAFDAERLVLTSLFEPDPAVSADERMIPDVALRLGLLRRFDGAFRLQADDVNLGRVQLRDLELQATLANGVLELGRLGAKGRAGAIEARGTLDAREEAGRVHIEAVARDLALGLLADVPDDDLARADLDLDLRASGGDLRALAAGLDGVILLDLRRGEIEADRLASVLFGDLFRQVLATVQSGAGERDLTRIDCAIFPLAIVRGRVSHVPHALIRTDLATLMLDGDIDLATEAIDLDVRSRPRRKLSLSAAELLNPYVRFEGTLTRPRPVLDQRGALISGGAAALSGGLSILGRMALDRVGAGTDVCARTVESALGSLGGRLPDSSLTARLLE